MKSNFEEDEFIAVLLLHSGLGTLFAILFSVSQKVYLVVIPPTGALLRVRVPVPRAGERDSDAARRGRAGAGRRGGGARTATHRGRARRSALRAAAAGSGEGLLNLHPLSRSIDS